MSRTLILFVASAAVVVVCLPPVVHGQMALPVGDTTQTLNLSGREIPYRLFVPKTPVPASGYPLLVALHGGGDDHTKFFTGYDNGKLKRLAQQANLAVACPRTQPSGGYRGAAEEEVLLVLTDVQAKMPVDKQRVFLFGHSMGGTGALELLLAHGDKFAAAASFAGPVAAEQAGGFRGKRVYLAHGDADEIVPVQYSRRLAHALQRAGVAVKYHEIKGADHNSAVAAEMGAIITWFIALPAS